jgi:hypothetical protein
MMDDGFLEKINGPFLCLSAAILCHALRCWQTGKFIDDVNFTRFSSQGKDKRHSLETSDDPLMEKQGYWNVCYKRGRIRQSSSRLILSSG